MKTTTNLSLASSVYGALIAALALSMDVHAQFKAIDIYVDDPRPVLKAVLSLSSQYSTIVTYEDPQYLFPGDLADVTLQVRRDLEKYPPGQAPKIMVPRTQALAVRYDGMIATGEPSNWRQALDAIVDAHDANASGGRFEVRQTESVFHVVPTRTRNAQGQWVAFSPMLDTRIAISAQDVDGVQMLQLICDALVKETGKHVKLGTIPLNPLLRYRGSIKAENEPARDVLLRTVQGASKTLTWQFLYGVTTDSFAINLTGVYVPRPLEAPPAQQPPRPSTPPGESPYITPEGRAAAERARDQSANQ